MHLKNANLNSLIKSCTFRRASRFYLVIAESKRLPTIATAFSYPTCTNFSSVTSTTEATASDSR